MSRFQLPGRRGSIRDPAVCFIALVGLLAATGCDPSPSVKRGVVIGCQGPVCVKADITIGPNNGTSTPVTVTPTITVTGGNQLPGHRITVWIDSDNDGNIDVDEDANGNGVLDPGEDVDGDGKLDGKEEAVQTSSTPPPIKPGPTAPPRHARRGESDKYSRPRGKNGERESSNRGGLHRSRR